MTTKQEHSRQLVVLGAGVIGLSVAHLAATRGFKVTIVARDMPEDMDSQAWASPFAVRYVVHLSHTAIYDTCFVCRVQIGPLCQWEGWIHASASGKRRPCEGMHTLVFLFLVDIGRSNKFWDMIPTGLVKVEDVFANFELH